MSEDYVWAVFIQDKKCGCWVVVDLFKTRDAARHYAGTGRTVLRCKTRIRKHFVYNCGGVVSKSSKWVY